jgi:hypothetical protein
MGYITATTTRMYFCKTRRPRSKIALLIWIFLHNINRCKKSSCTATYYNYIKILIHVFVVLQAKFIIDQENQIIPSTLYVFILSSRADRPWVYFKTLIPEFCLFSNVSSWKSGLLRCFSFVLAKSQSKCNICFWLKRVPESAFNNKVPAVPFETWN